MSGFRLWLEENDLAVPASGGAVFLDLDNTLVHSVYDDELPEARSPRMQQYLARSPRTSAAGESFVVCLRPGAVRFVQSLSSLGDVYILSMGSRPYVEAVQKTVRFPVRQAFSAREMTNGSLGEACQLFRDGEQVRPFVLVDNLDSSHGFTRHKLGVLGFQFWEPVPSEIFQLVPTWKMTGEESLGDNALAACLPRVRRKVAAQRQGMPAATGRS